MSHALIEDVEHGVVFVETDFKSCVGTERDIAEDDAQSDGDEQQRLEVFLDGEPDKEGSHHNHDQVPDRRIGKGGVGQEFMKVLYDKLS